MRLLCDWCAPAWDLHRASAHDSDQRAQLEDRQEYVNRFSTTPKPGTSIFSFLYDIYLFCGAFFSFIKDTCGDTLPEAVI